MSVVTVKINNKVYQISCEPGQESILTDSAAKIDQEVGNLKNYSPTATTEYLLLLTAIKLQHQLDSKTLGKDNSNLELDKLLVEITSYIESLALKIKK